MSTKIFINLPVKDLKASMAFYEGIGFANNPQFTNEKAAGMAISEHNYVMLLTHEFFKTFTDKPIADARKTVGALLAISRGSKAEAERTNAEMEQRFEVLKGKPFDVQEANLTAKGKGIVYRSVVGPPGSLAFANSLCEQVKAAGHTDCWPVRY